MSGADEYYQLARRLGGMDRQSLAVELRALHQQTVDATVEYVADMLREGRERGEGLEQIEAAVRSVELQGRHIVDDRLHLRYAEAVLYVARNRKTTLIVARRDVRDAFDAGHGVELARDNPTMIEVVAQPGKFAGQ